MRIYLDKTVYDAALDRIRWLFSEFENIYVSFSGGKDSTVILNLCLKVAEEKGRLPLNVFFLDQEAEWDSVIKYTRSVMTDPRVKPFWVQTTIKILNATGFDQQWLECWKPGEQWLREKEPYAITENVYGTNRFHKFFGAFLKYHHPKEKACQIGGVRAEESPARSLGLTSQETYKGETWGGINKANLHYVFYPIYDWSYTDVWKAIHSEGWPYCTLYNEMYRYGVPVQKMRVSNVHHETAISSLYYLQEVEPDLWNRLAGRIGGINTAGQMQGEFTGGKLKKHPPMFTDWRDYREHLWKYIVPTDAQKAQIRKVFSYGERIYEDPAILEAWYRANCSMILTNDFEGTHADNFHVNYRGKMITAKERKSREQSASANS